MVMIKEYDMPDELYYSTRHMWLRVEGDEAVVGVTDFTQKAAGEVTYVELPSEGDRAEAGELVGSMETGKWMGKLYAPVSGEITAVNTDLDDNPGLINEDPYGKGWIFRVRLSDRSEVDALMHGPAVAPWLEKEIAANIK